MKFHTAGWNSRTAAVLEMQPPSPNRHAGIRLQIDRKVLRLLVCSRAEQRLKVEDLLDRLQRRAVVVTDVVRVPVVSLPLANGESRNIPIGSSFYAPLSSASSQMMSRAPFAIFFRIRNQGHVFSEPVVALHLNRGVGRRDFTTGLSQFRTGSGSALVQASALKTDSGNRRARSNSTPARPYKRAEILQSQFANRHSQQL